MKYLGISALVIFSFASHGNQLDSVYTIAEQMPEFKYGGVEGMTNFLLSNVMYPIKARANNIKGAVYVKFIVDTFGNVGNVEVLKDLGHGCGEQAIKAIQFMNGMFKSGIHKGEKVLVQLVVPIKFDMANTFPSGGSGAIYIDNDDNFRKNLNALYNYGVRKYEKGEYEYAIQIFKNVIEYEPIDYDAYYNLGVAYFKLGEIEEACNTWNTIQQAKLTVADSAIIKYCKK